MRLALFEPEIPQNTGTILRLAACLGVAVDIIEPCGFLLSDRRLRRSGMDYLDKVDLARHPSWHDFIEKHRAGAGRLVLLTSAAQTPYTGFAFECGDTLLLGRESAGVPDAVRAVADGGVRVPMAPGLRSLNVAIVAAMVVGEALRQTKGFPGEG